MRIESCYAMKKERRIKCSSGGGGVTPTKKFIVLNSYMYSR